MNKIVRWWLITAAALLAVTAFTIACDDGGEGGGGLDDGTGDTDTDADSDGDADSCTEIAWGSGLNPGSNVANWTQNGYWGSNFDGVVEETAVDFTLEEMNCAGFNSIVLMIGDTG